jgi:hypothetical protein
LLPIELLIKNKPALTVADLEANLVGIIFL